MQRIIALLAIICLLLSITNCGTNEKQERQTGVKGAKNDSLSQLPIPKTSAAPKIVKDLAMLKLYYAAPFHEIKKQPFSSQLIRLTHYFRPDSSIIDDKYLVATANDMEVFTCLHTLSSEQRKNFLDSVQIHEEDNVYIYSFTSDTVFMFPVKDLPIIAHLSIYASPPPEKTINVSPDQFVVGFKIDKPNLALKADDNIVYIGKQNIFQTGKISPMNWKKIPANQFPVKFDTEALSLLTTRPTKTWKQDDCYTCAVGKYDYFIQKIETRPGAISARHLMVKESNTGEKTFERVFIKYEGSFFAPINPEKDFDKQSPEAIQWAGELFRGYPPIYYGAYLGHSFGCRSVYVTDKAQTRIPILCDNRH